MIYRLLIDTVKPQKGPQPFLPALFFDRKLIERKTWVTGHEFSVTKSKPTSEDGRGTRLWKLWR